MVFSLSKVTRYCSRVVYSKMDNKELLGMASAVISIHTRITVHTS